jgi:ABC-type nickel/cobalt efflux system permease component RcnA
MRRFFVYASGVVKEVTPSLESFWARQSGLLSVLVIVIVSALGFVLDVSLLKEGFPRHDLTLVSNVIIGIIAGWLFYQFARNEKAKRDAVRQRMRTIADLNHHIRNALQVIRYAGGSKSAQDATQLQLINEAVARIEWALREVLPQYSHAHSDPPGQSSDGGTPLLAPTVVDDFVLRHK